MNMSRRSWPPPNRQDRMNLLSFDVPALRVNEVKRKSPSNQLYSSWYIMNLLRHLHPCKDRHTSSPYPPWSLILVSVTYIRMHSAFLNTWTRSAALSLRFISRNDRRFPNDLVIDHGANFKSALSLSSRCSRFVVCWTKVASPGQAVAKARLPSCSPRHFSASLMDTGHFTSSRLRTI